MDEPTEKYAQDDPEYQPFAEEATKLVEMLKNGDSSGLAVLPEQYQKALSKRMNQRLQETDNGTITPNEFDVEIKKMISVACIGLREADDGLRASSQQ